MNTKTEKKQFDETEIELNAEEMEAVIAPGGVWTPNHNETLQKDHEVDLNAEEMEEVIAPGGIWVPGNHNETMLVE